MTTNPHLKNLIEAKRTYDDHVHGMQAKYGYVHTDDQPTTEEAMERADVAMEYRVQSGLFMGYRNGEE